MLLHSCSQLLTLAGGPQRGRSIGNLGIIENGAAVIRGEKILAVGTTAELKASYPDEPTLDAGGCVVLPGFVDPHTHLVWAGDRADEFAKKMAGTQTQSSVAAVRGEQRVAEIARMLGGEKLSDTTLAHAKEMLQTGA